jgi:peroxiredoxin
MEFLKQYPDDYFSFWYFIQQVAQPNSVLGNDTAYLKQQVTYLKAVFPAKYTGSIEGKSLIKRYEAALPPLLQLNDDAPAFSLTTVNGSKISLSDFKGKYVLLDFWATWCPPCRAEIPYVKEIRKKYSLEKLAIVGISADYDSKKLTAFVKEQRMNWLHFYDKHREVGQLYRVDAIPVLILINKEGKMVYNSNLKGNDKDVLSKLLEGLN